jgi:hypothetical protein
MKLRVIRDRSTERSTLGALFVDGRFFGWTLEDVVREKPGVPVADWKIPKKTAIPVGTYALQVTPSARFQRPLPLLLDVPGFTGIRMHRGNTAEDTEGCLVVGQTRGQDFVGGSTPMEAALVALLGAGKHVITIEPA